MTVLNVCSMLLTNLHTPAESNNISVVLCRCRFAELGHSVVGIEASTIPIEAFFNEHKLQYSVEVCKEISGNLYKVGAHQCNIYI